MEAARRRAERKSDLKALAIVLVILLPLAFVAWRPAVILGVEPGALARSVSGEVPGRHFAGACRSSGNDTWVCSVIDSGARSGGTPYQVHTPGPRCWDAVQARPLRGLATQSSGCNGFFDALSPL